MLPDVGPIDTKDYALILQEHVKSVHGTTRCKPGKDEFLARLKISGLTRRQFDALYFHEFVQNHEQRVDCICRKKSLRPIEIGASKYKVIINYMFLLTKFIYQLMCHRSLRYVNEVNEFKVE